VAQYLAKDVGVFFRAMYSDGQSEVDAFNSADEDLSFGATAKGALWHRPFDVTGIGLGLSGISAVHARYLEMGGVDGFVGDGHLTPGTEGVAEIFYSVNLLKAIWLAGDYQFLWNPGFNEARGPVHIFGAKVHAEF
jgi:carbohydrate-selective porin OprB